MFEYFKESHPNIICSEDTYRRRVKKKNTSFSKLGEEECESCEGYINHECKADLLIEGNLKSVDYIGGQLSKVRPGICGVCDDWVKHIKSAKK